MVLELRKEKAIRASRRMRNHKDAPCGCGGCATRTNPALSPSSSIIKKKTKKSRRKTRSKTRKPKYLSLRLQLISTDHKPQDQSITESEMPTPPDDHPHLNLFPLHPEINLVEDKDTQDENNMAYLFSAADGGATTLTALLGAATTSSTSSVHEDTKNQTTPPPPTTTTTSTLSPSASLTYSYGRGRPDYSEEVALVRTAMRNKEREPSEERWVRYSEVVERRRDDQEVSSCCAAATADLRSRRNQGLSLKLDYEEILNAWSDKGPLYIRAPADSPQTVPDMHDHFLTSQLSHGSSDGWGNNGGCVWRVPEMMMTSKANEQGPTLIKVKAEEQQEQQVEAVAGEESKVGQREASVQRYKEKRQNRLFSKRIRYQVRKLNAEKRPRLKGRFVKRS